MTIEQKILNPNYYTFVKDNIKKKRQKDIYISYEHFFDLNILLEEFKNSCKVNTRYSIIVRVCYDNNSSQEWKSVGEQVGLFFENLDELHDCISLFQRTFINRINLSMELYKKDEEDILYFQIMIYNVEYTNIAVKRKSKFNIHDLGSHKDLLNVTKTTNALNKILPLTSDTKHFGNLLERRGNIIIINGIEINFLERINKFLLNKLVELDSDLLFYYNSESNTIISVKSSGPNKIIDIYSFEGMKIHNNIIDTQIKNSDNFVRKTGNVLSLVTPEGIKNNFINTNFEPVYPEKPKKGEANLLHPDWKIGTMDIETFEYSHDISKPYAAGFYANKEAHTFYVDSDLNYDNVILKCIDAMLVEKYHKYTFFIHNLGRFDSAFILNILIRANEIYLDKYICEPVFRDEVVISINISSKINKKTYSIKLVDSYNILNSSLSELCEAFETEVKKTFFPYKFVNKNNLFYKGIKPDISYFKYKDKKVEKIIDKEVYNNIPKEWSMEDETIKYLSIDLISLYNVIDKFRKEIFIKYNTQVSKSTISGLAMDIFLRNYYDYNIPLINKTSVYNDIKSSHFGGITEVYRPHGKDLFLYDVNSLYPFSALNPMPGLNCTFLEKINKDISKCLDSKDFFGFYYCEIETNNDYIGLLPQRTDTGIVMPLGKIKGWYFSEELKFAFENGYKIHVISGYRFDKNEKVFDKYVNEMYKIKSTTKDSVLRATAKSLLNNLLGRFGLNLEKYVTKLMTLDEYYEILQYKKVKGVPKFIGQNKAIVTHGVDVSKDICDMHNVDYQQTSLNDIKFKRISKIISKESTHHDVSIAIASAVTAYSRIFMNKIKLDILSKGGKIYYTDTDSIVTDIKLDNSLVGIKLGQFKLEHEIEEAYFISTKTYCIRNNKGKVIIKSKTADSSKLSFEDFENLYLGKNVETIRNESIRDFTKGSVMINKPKKIKLNANVYNKRTKVFENNLWVDTKPIYNNYHTSAQYPFIERIPKLNLPKLSILKFSIPKLNIPIKSMFKKGIIKKLLLIWLIIILMLDSIENSYMYSYLYIDMDLYRDLFQDLDNNITDLEPKENNAINLYKNKDYGYIPIDNLNQIYKTNQNVYSSFNILNNVFESHLNSVVKEVESANKTISDLKLELMNEKISHHNYRLEVFNEVFKSNQKREEIVYRINEACTFVDSLIAPSKKP